jgi:hypothetical protein
MSKVAKSFADVPTFIKISLFPVFIKLSKLSMSREFRVFNTKSRPSFLCAENVRTF